MHTSLKNTGNGANSGKAAWLVVGSYLAKLEKKGWIRKNRDEKTVRVYISPEGKRVLQAHKVNNSEQSRSE